MNRRKIAAEMVLLGVLSKFPDVMNKELGKSPGGIPTKDRSNERHRKL